MKNMIDIDVILDNKYTEPRITIHAKSRSKQIEKIISAIENVSDDEFPLIPAYTDNKMELLSQRDIIRVYTQGRKIIVQTADRDYTVNKTLAVMEDTLNEDRFIRISQSEIVNLYKVKHFEFSTAGTIGIEFENGSKSWASRSRVKAIKAKLKG